MTMMMMVTIMKIITMKVEVEECIPLPPYTPINPFTMPLSGAILLERSEPGRLDVRLNSLREELKAFGYQETRR